MLVLESDVLAKIEKLREKVEQCPARDRARFLSTLDGVERAVQHGRRVGQRFSRVAAEIEEAVERRAERLKGVPVLSFPEALPVVEKRSLISTLIEHNQVVILCGETGSGKTTQVPKICLELGRGIDGLIGHTQPRRIAARRVAERISHELKTPLERTVGYKIRFSDRTSPQCYLKLMTDGILLAETQGDALLSQYDTIIIDEAHERSLNIDFLLGYLKRILPKRPDLKIIIMSATIDPKRFSEHFDDAPMIEVSGRVYPVDVMYRPIAEADPDERDRTVQDAILDAVDELATYEPGDVLVFLSGERDIRETAEALRKHHPPGTEILPLYARLSTKEQNRVFQSHSGRRVVLATNVAETSLTVPGIRYVVDPGYARISRFNSQTKVQRLPIEAVSQASADQRMGRCGRLSAGRCVRLYSEEDYQSRPGYTQPEILRSNLAGVILQMAALKLGSIDEFPFMDPPDSKAVRGGWNTLYEIGAFDRDQQITDIGRRLARLPIDPRLGRMLLAADEEDCLTEVLIIASALSVQDPRQRPMEKADQADEAHAKFRDEKSDFIAFVNLWTFYHEQAMHLSKSKLRKLCQIKYLSYLRLREWHDIHRQLKILMTGMGFKLNPEPAEYDAIHRALLSGLTGQVGMKGERTTEYTGARGVKFHLFPGSGLFKKAPKWVLVGELVRTTKLYARVVAQIRPEWIEHTAEHLVKKTYSEPHWQARSAHVGAFEKVSLFGLEIVSGRRVHYGPIDPVVSRRIFIEQGLVEGEYRTNAPYARHNHDLLKRVESFEVKARKRHLLADPSARFAFYDRRLPKDVYNDPLYEKWRKRTERRRPKRLFMSMEDVLGADASDITPESYPDHITLGGNRMAIGYRFEPGTKDDGITLTVPIELLATLDEHQLEWLIPGWLPEKVASLIRLLPKNWRTNFQPINAIAHSIANHMNSDDGRSDRSFLEALSEYGHQRTGVRVPTEVWQVDRLADYFRFYIKVVDREENVQASGRDQQVIRAELQLNAEHALANLPDSEYNRTNVTEWDFGILPKVVDVQTPGGLTVKGYPAIVDSGQADSVSLCLMPSEGAVQMHYRAGLRKLYLISMRDELKHQAKQFPNWTEMATNYASLGSGTELREELMLFVADRLFFDDDGELVRTRDAFDRRLVSCGRKLHVAVGEACSFVSDILRAYHAVDLRLSDRIPPAWDDAIDDIERQLAYLFCRRFLVTVPVHWLRQYPRYLAAIEKRIDKLGGGGLSRDKAHRQEVAPLWKAYLRRKEDHTNRRFYDPALEQYRWMIEEMRVSVFAQELGTIVPVSLKRLRRQWDEVEG